MTRLEGPHHLNSLSAKESKASFLKHPTKLWLYCPHNSVAIVLIDEGTLDAVENRSLAHSLKGVTTHAGVVAGE